MLTITLTRGLPASGKSTWAKEQVAASNGAVKRVNKDDLRDMIDCGRWTKANEEFVLKIRDAMVFEALRAGKSVIVDDTNFAPCHYESMRNIARSMRLEGRQVQVEVKDFTDVPVETCIERDLKRAKSVGEKVIRDMHNKYLRPRPGKPEFNPALPDCIIIDLDGTTAINNGHRGWYDESKCYDDEVNYPVLAAIKAVLALKPTAPVFVSGRKETCKDDTLRFIKEKLVITPERLLMRAADDNRCDSIVKRELYEEHIKNKFNVLHVWDDRDRVVEMWRGLGLTVFQVAYGNF